jgi:leucyl-tRNA synthetase
MTVPAGTRQGELRRRALALPRVAEMLAGTEPKKVIAVVDRVVNVVI